MVVKFKNRMETITGPIEIGKLQKMYINKELILLPQFLQRDLKTSKWWENYFQNCKEYIVSICKGTNNLDTFSIVPLSRIIEVVEEKTNSAAKSQIQEYKRILNLLNSYKKIDKEVYVCLDGQSRLVLAIMTYLNGEYCIDIDNDIELELDDKKSNIMDNTIFTNLPDEVKSVFLSFEVTLNIVTSFNKLEDVIESLVNKQKGFSWTWFQIFKQKNRFNIFTIKMIENIKSTFIDAYESIVYKKINEVLQPDSDGAQAALVNLIHFYETGFYPKKDNVENLFLDKNQFNTVSYETIQNYCMELFEQLNKSDTKLQLTPLINYVALRQLMDDKKSNSKFYNQFKLNKKYKIIDEEKFITYFYEMHYTLTSSKIPHKASYIFDAESNEYFLLKNGYASSCGAQNDEDIKNRMKFLLNEFEFDKLLSEGIIAIDSKKPKKSDVLVANDFKDVNGKKLLITEYSKLDISHFISKHNKGTNNMENLGLEHFSSNRSRQEKNLKNN